MVNGYYKTYSCSHCLSVCSLINSCPYPDELQTLETTKHYFADKISSTHIKQNLNVLTETSTPVTNGQKKIGPYRYTL